MNNSLGRNLGAGIISRTSFVRAAAEASIAGAAIDLQGFSGVRALSLRAIVAAEFNADDGDSLNVSAIKLQSAVDSAFTTPVDRVTGSNIVLTGATGDSNVNYREESEMDLDLTSLPVTHRYIRLVATPTRSDTTNTVAAVSGVFVFGGLQEAPLS